MDYITEKCMYHIKIAIACCKVYDSVQQAKINNFEKMKQSEYFFSTIVYSLAYRANMETSKLSARPDKFESIYRIVKRRINYEGQQESIFME